MEKLPMDRDSAFELLKKYAKSEDMNHYLESEAVMRAVAEKLDEDVEYYGMLGLLHDIDWSLTKDDPKKHLTLAPQILKENGFSEEFIEIILSHGYGFDVAGLKDKQRNKPIEHCLAASETITGLIHAYALMRGGIDGMKVKGLKKKFKDKAFAAGVDREIIKEIEKCDIELNEFFEISIRAIQSIKDKVGL